MNNYNDNDDNNDKYVNYNKSKNYVENHNVENHNVENQNVENQNVENQNVENHNIENHDIENQNVENHNFVIEGEYLENNDNIYIENNMNSPLEKFKTYNALFGSKTIDMRSFKKSQSYPNNCIQNDRMVVMDKFKNCSNDIELIDISTNPLINYNDINETNNITNETHGLINNKNKNNYAKYYKYFTKIYYWFGSAKIEMLNKFISIILHILIMVIFEIYFYFNFVINIEKEQFLGKIQQYIHEFKQNLNLDQTQKELIHQIIKRNLDDNFLTQLYTLYIQSLKQQKKLLYRLMIKSCRVTGIFGIVLLGLIMYSLYKGYKIKWKWVWMENILMFVLLGIFEYWFFMNVILNYNPITDAEIKYLVANQFVSYFNSTA